MEKEMDMEKKYYDDGRLKFEGEYYYDYKLKGKEYIKGKLEYEGEYCFDWKWDGKGYDEDGDIIYELHNGNGKVKQYFEDNELMFEGEFLNWKRQGKGKVCPYPCNVGELISEGEYINLRLNGKG